MKILVNNKTIDSIIKPLGLRYNELDKINLDGFKFTFDEYNRFYIEKDSESKEQAIIIELTNDDVYKLDAFESAIDFRKKSIVAADIYCYFKVFKNSYSNVLSIDEINNNFKSNKGMNHCDLNLLIPCKTQKGIDDSDFNVFEHELSTERAVGFKNIINDEFGSDYIKRIERYSLGEVVLHTKDGFRARGFLELAYHDDTRFCVLEIYIPNISFGANKILNCYLADFLEFEHDGVESKSINSFLENLKLRPYGRKRSMVFCNDSVLKKEIINTLANEEVPMGKIGGTFSNIVDNENIALYDTAKVYVSNATMIEVCKVFEEDYYARYEYQILETFFVELILLEDAAIDKIYKDLMIAQDAELTSKANSSEIIDEISFDMSKAKRFADFESINFPTVRESAYRIAEKFGINSVFEKYEENKNILQDMIAVNRREIEEHENNIKNNFLFIISAITLFGQISGVIDVFVKNQGLSYIFALIVVSLAYLLYKYIIKKYEESVAKKSLMEERHDKA